MAATRTCPGCGEVFSAPNLAALDKFLQEHAEKDHGGPWP